MSISTATFAVQRGDTTYGCVGSELPNKMQPGDSLLVAREGVNYSYTVDSIFEEIEDSDELVVTDVDGVTYRVSGEKFKDLFYAPLRKETSPYIEGVNMVGQSLRLVDPGSITGGIPPYSHDKTDWYATDPNEPDFEDIIIPPNVASAGDDTFEIDAIAQD